MTRARLYSAGGGGSNSTVAIATILPTLTTANVNELTNLYFSNSRVLANIRLASVNEFKDVESGPKANGQALIWNGFVWAASNIASATALSNTDSLVEGVTNKYFSNARARAAITAADPTIIIDWSTGTIRANVTAIANAASSSDGVVEGNVNKYFTNARVFANLQLASIKDLIDVEYPGYSANDIPNGQTLVWNADRGYWEPNVYSIGHAFSADVAQEANVVLSLNNFTTDDLREGANSKYLTVGVLTNLVANLSIDVLLDVNTQSNLSVSKVLAWDGLNWVPKSVSDLANVTSAGSSDFASRAALANVALLANVANTVLSISNFTTANVRESSSNLYFTYARVNAFVQPALTTANVKESSSNLYFTTARVNAFVQPFLTTANVIESASNLYYTDSRVVTAATPLLTTANVVESVNNWYFTNTRVLAAIASGNTTVGQSLTVGQNLVVAQDLTVSGNVVTLAVGNVQIEARTITLAKDATGKTQAEGAGILINGANAKITYTEAGDAVTLNKQFIISGNILPSISGTYNLGSPDKKFLSVYLGTQTIYLGNITLGESPTGGLDVKTPSGDPSDGNFANLTATEQFWINRVYSNVFPLTELNAYIGGNVYQWSSNTTGNLYFGIRKDNDYNKFAGIRVVETRTSPATVRSDVIIYNDAEGANTSRARIAVLGDGNTNITGDIYQSAGNKFYGNVKGDLLGNVTGLVSSIRNFTTANLAEWPTNLYYTNSRVVSAVVPVLTTANVSELGNLYYTNARARTAITGGTGVAVNWGTGAVSIGQDVSTTANVTFWNVSVTNNLTVYGGVERFQANNLVVSDNMIYLNNGSINSNPDVGFAFNYNDGTYHHAGFFRDHRDGVFKAFENYSPEPDANIFIDTSHATYRVANIQATTFIGNLQGTISSLDNQTTSALKEGSNLYYTSARAIAAVSPFLTTANVAELTNKYYTDSRVVTAATPLLTTANVVEINGQFHYSNSRSLGYIQTLSINELSDVDTVTRTPAAGYALIYDGTNWVANIISAQASPFSETSNVANSVISLDGHTTTEIVEGTNLYFTNARVLTGITTGTVEGNVTVDGTIVANNFVTGSGTGGTITGATLVSTTNLVATNVTSSRWFNLYTANVIETAGNLYFTTTRAIAAVTPLLTAANIANFNSTVISDITPLLTAANIANFNSTVVSTVTPLLTTSNVAEGSNLYYTPARVYANVEQMSINVFADVNMTGIQNNGILIWNGTQFVSGSVSAASSSNIALYSYLAEVANTAVSASSANTVISIGNHTTTELAEGANLYYRDSRVYSNVALMSINTLADVDLTGVGTDSVLIWDGVKFVPSYLVNKLNTANVVEYQNLYFTNARAVAAIQSSDVLLGNLRTTGLLTVSSGLGAETTTGIEFFNNPAGGTGDSAKIQYYAANYGVNDDTVLEISVSNNAGDSINLKTAGGGLGFNVARPTQDVDFDGNTLIRKNLTISNKLFGSSGTFTGKLEANGLTVNGTEIVNGDGGLTNVVATRITANIWSGIYTANVIESPGFLYFTNARVAPALLNQDLSLHDVTVTGNLVVQGDVTTLNTAVLSVEDKNITIASGATNGAQADGAGITVAGADATINYFVVGDKFVTNKSFEVDGVLRANSWSGLYTSNVVETPSYQYFTTARAVATITPLLTTANVSELGNLYFTGTRAVNAVTPLLTTANTLELTNLYYTNSRVISAVTPLLTTSNVAEGSNLYFTTARVYANVEQMSVNVLADVDITGVTNGAVLVWNTNKFVVAVPSLVERANVANTVVSLSNHTTTDLSEGNNLYYTNSRVVSAVIPLLTTANVIEDTNLYFTNTRVLTGITTDTVQGNVAISDTITANSFVSGSGTGGSITGARLLSATNVNATNVTASNWFGLYTANVIESDNNLYYTNSRVNSYLSTLSIDAFGDVDLAGVTTGSILVYDGDKFIVGSATTATHAETANVANTVLSLGNFTTTDLAEGNNLYFTNTRVLTGITTDTVQGNITVSDTIFANTFVAGQGTTGYITGAALITSANIIADRIVANTLVINSSLTSAVNVTDVQTPDPYLVTKFNIAKYRSAEYIYTVKGKSGYAGLFNSGKILLLHDDSTVYFTQYGILLTGDGTELVSFSADINNSNVRLFASVTNPAIVCDIRLSGTTYTEA